MVRIMKFARTGEGGAKEVVTVEIAADGNVKVITAGFSGEACYRATGDLERALGKKVAEMRTPEYDKMTRNTQGAGR